MKERRVLVYATEVECDGKRYAVTAWGDGELRDPEQWEVCEVTGPFNDFVKKKIFTGNLGKWISGKGPAGSDSAAHQWPPGMDDEAHERVMRYISEGK